MLENSNTGVLRFAQDDSTGEFFRKLFNPAANAVSNSRFVSRPALLLVTDCAERATRVSRPALLNRPPARKRRIAILVVGPRRKP